MNRVVLLSMAMLAFFRSGSTSINCGQQIKVILDDGDAMFTDIEAATEPYLFFVNDVELNYTGWELLAASCKPTEATSNSLTFTWDLGDCEPTMDVNDTHIQYTYSIWHKPMLNESTVPSIARYEINEAQIECTFPRFIDDGATSPAIVPNLIHTTHDIGEFTGDFTFSIELTNSSWTSGSAPATVDVDDWIYVKVSLDQTTDELVDIEFEDCFAHSKASGGYTYELVEDGCAVDTAWDPAGSIEIVQSGTEQEAHLKMKSWVWNDGAASQEIYVTCSVMACRENCVDATTEPDCPVNALVTKRRRRRRRSARSSASEQFFTLMAGPMEVVY